MKTALKTLCAVAAAAALCTVFSQCCKHEEAANPADAVINNILTRTSIREYTEEPVSEPMVETLLRAGMAAPTAVNRQPWHFVVVNDKAVISALADANPRAKMLRQAPLAIVVCGNMDKTVEGEGQQFWIQDCSAATENILLAAHALGLGAVWTANYPIAERCDAVRATLRIPDHLVPLCTIVIGHPAQQPEPKQKFTTDNVSYNGF